LLKQTDFRKRGSIRSKATNITEIVSAPVVPLEVPRATSALRRFSTAKPQDCRLIGRHDSGGDVIVEGDGDGWLVDGNGRRRDDRQKQAFETLACLRQLRWAARVDLTADMMRDKADDAFAIGKRQPFPCVRKPVSRSRCGNPGLSMTSMTPGSSSHAVIAGPSVRFSTYPHALLHDGSEAKPLQLQIHRRPAGPHSRRQALL
jgi:hypothetical protein